MRYGRGGRRGALELCEEDRARLNEQQPRASSLPSTPYSGGSHSAACWRAPGWPEGGTPEAAFGDREALDLDTFLNEEVEELLQRAAQTAVEWVARRSTPSTC